MTKNSVSRTRWPIVVITAVVAGIVGFGAARWSSPAPARAPAADKVGAAAPAADADEVKIPDEYLAAANIAVEPIVPGGVGTEILAPATVAAQPGQEAVVVARVAGTVSRINRQLGDAVKAGDVLALVDSADAATLASDRAVAVAKAELAKRVFARESMLFEQGVTPRQDMESSKAALDVAAAESRRASTAAQTARLTSNGRSVALVSPITGRVSASSITLGGHLGPETETFRVSAAGNAQVEASVTAAELGRIQAGADATIVLSTGSPIAGRVRALTPTVAGGSRSAIVVVVPMEPTDRLVIGEGVQVRLRTTVDASQALAVPEDAVQNIDGRDVVFVRTERGFRAQPVMVGARSGGTAQILSGAKAGDSVATRNAFLVKAEMKKGGGDD